LLGESGDDRAIVPLLNCYMAYLAPEELFIEYWKECSVSVPETYRDIFDLIKKYGIKSLNDSAAQQRYKDAISGTVVGNVRDEDHALKMIFFAHSVRLSIVRSLSRINSVNIKGIFQRMLSREHNTVVIEELSLELGKLGDTQVIPNLVALLENPKAAQRFMTMDLVVQIIDILGNFSEHHEQAFEAITKLYEFDGEKKFLCGHQEIRDHAFALLQRFPNRQPEVEEMKKRMGWRSDGHCELCGNKVGFLDRLLGKVRCKEHQATA